MNEVGRERSLEIMKLGRWRMESSGICVNGLTLGV